MSEEILVPVPLVPDDEPARDPEQEDWALITEACSWCSIHHIQECSPIRNGCGHLDQQRQALARRYADAE